ncbi:MAG: DUF6531 domain-containing protein, partial [Actinobacteria bacterium]|nr:DUF6531 domain-containing protein [Actinomycetota bacterium]
MGLENFYPYRSWNLGGTGKAFVNMATGNLVVQYTDFDIPGQGLNMHLTRTYNSESRIDGPLGPGWTLGVAEGEGSAESAISGLASVDIGRALEAAATETAFNFIDGDGTRHSFVKDGFQGQGWHSPPGVNLILSDAYVSGSRQIYATRPDGVTYTFTTTNTSIAATPERFSLDSIRDRKGNLLAFKYDENGYLATMADGAGRSIQFDYYTIADKREFLKDSVFSNGRQFETTVYSVDPATGLGSSTEAAGTQSQRTTSYLYLPGFGLISTQDSLGHGTDFYGDGGQMLELVDRSGNGWGLNYSNVTLSNCHAPTGVTGAAVCLSGPASSDEVGNSPTQIWTNVGYNLVNLQDEGDVSDSGSSRKNSSSYVWSGNRLASETDEVGTKKEYRYSSLGQITSSTVTPAEDNTHPFTTRFEYQTYPTMTAVGDLVTTTAGYGSTDERKWVTSVDGRGNLTSTRDPLGKITAFNYYPKGLLRSVTDARAKTTTYGVTSASDGAYDSSGQPTQTVDATGKTRLFFYDFLGRLIQTRDRESKVWSRYTDLRGNVFLEKDPLGHSVAHCFDANDNETVRIQPLGIVVDTTQTAVAADCASTSNQHSTVMTYDQRDLMATKSVRSDSQLRKTAYAYYPDGQLQWILEPRSFDASTGQPVSVQQKATYTYYPDNRLRAFVDEENNQTDFIHTPNGNLRKVTDPTSNSDATRHSTTYSYNWRGQVKSTQETGHTGSTVNDYNIHGEKTKVTNPAGNATSFSYDVTGRPRLVTNTAGDVSERRYDDVGNLTYLAQPTGTNSKTEVTYTYTDRNEIATETDPADTLHATSYEYDNEGRQRYRRDSYNSAIERTVENKYFDDGRLKSKTATGPNLTSHISNMDYDADGNMTTMTATDGATTISSVSAGYTSADELKTWDENLFSIARSSSYTYAPDGQLESRTIDGTKTAYEYLLSGLETKTSFGSSAQGVFTSTYFPSGKPKHSTIPNAVNVDYLYDSADRLLSKTVARGYTNDTSVLSRWNGIGYDQDDNKTQESYSAIDTDTTVKTGSGSYG